MAQMTAEQWMPVSGYEGLYEVSDRGRVRRVDRRPPLVMRQIVARGGYRHVTVSRDHRPRMFRVHRLVADAFLPADSTRPEIDHIDCDPSNNYLSNLVRASRRENVLRAVRAGRLSPPRADGVHNGHARLTEDDVRAIRSARGVSQYALSREFGVCRTQIRNIQRGRQWTSVREFPR